MTFAELPINTIFTFHNFDGVEKYVKISETQCISEHNSIKDRPLDMNCAVYVVDYRRIAKTTVRRDAYGEYVVRAYDQLGKRWPQADYYANNRDDAVDTARYMLNSLYQPFSEEV